MTEEVKKETTPTEVVKQPETNPNEVISIDLDGISIPNVPIALAKQIIEKRQAAKKEVAGLKEQVAKVEAESKSAQQKANLLEAMKSQDIEAVKSQVSQEYLSKIAAYENKIFNGEIKSQLATMGVLPEALNDACTLALQGTKVTLDGDVIKVNDKDSKEFLAEWIKTKAHLVSVKSLDKKQGNKVVTPQAPKAIGKDRLNAGLANFLKTNK
jgi:predicted RNA-binding protein Jag